MSIDVTKAHVFQSVSPGGEKLLLGTLTLSEEGALVGDLVTGEDWSAPQYFVVKVGEVPLSFSPTTDMDQLKRAAELMLKCELVADFEGQAWVGDYAMPVDDGKQPFNALPNLIGMRFVDFREMFSEGVDFDELANGVPARENHGGPFEVRVDDGEVAELIRVFSGKELEDVLSVEASTWQRFVEVAGVLIEQKKQSEVEVEPALRVVERG
jgi:hypothetical protein